MKKAFLFIALFYICLPAKAQHLIWIDSVTVSPSNPTTNDTIYMAVVGNFANTGVVITHIDKTINPGSVIIDFFTPDCAGFDVLIPFDTLVSFGPLPAGNYLIKYRAAIDTNLTDTINCAIVTAYSFYDSVSTNISVLQTGISAPGLHQFSLFPNPASSTFTLQNIPGPSLIQILNPFGEIIYSEKLNDKDEHIINPHLSPGFYFVQVTCSGSKWNHEQKKMVGKLVVR
jgi:hypothetical protein